jgi:hypothetical protein
MKTLLKLLVVVVILNGAYRMGMAEYRFSQLQESTRSMIVLGENTPVEELREQILKRAADLSLPVEAERIEVTRNGLRTAAKVSYHQDVEVFPGYGYPREYSFSEEITALR